MDGSRKWAPGFSVVLLTLLSHLTSALEVPLDREQSLLDSAKLKCGSERFIFSRKLTFS